MKLSFRNAGDLETGISLVSEDLGIQIVAETDAQLVVSVTQLPQAKVSVTLDGKTAVISYGDGKARFFRGLAILVSWIKAGKTQASVTETPLFSMNGAMVDMSRNAVMNVKTVKAMLRKMALMGLNTYMLYTEDTYKIEEYPYFGYMRGRYTPEDIRELDAYALELGIELIPCIQVLGHLATHLRWDAAAPYKDTANALLVGEDATYRLIEEMFKTVSGCFTSRRIHVGMDETHDLGTGAYLDKNGYRERQDIYFGHLEKIIELAKKHGLEPMMWSDMFFRLAGKGLPGYRDYDRRVVFTDEVIQKVPKGIQQVFWDYYKTEEEFYGENIQKHIQVFKEIPIFAGGIWTWSSHCPLFSRSLERTLPALDACKKAGVKEIFATIWHTGSESSLILSLAGLAWYADYDYRGGYDPEGVKTCFGYSCGESYDTIMKCELPENPDGRKISLTRGFLYNDPLVGLVDGHLEGFETADYYRNVTAHLSENPITDGLFAPAYDTVWKLSDLLIEKADFGVRLKKAYGEKDFAALEALAQECDRIAEKITALRRSHRDSWMTYNKPFGWEVLDIRYGGLLSRFDTAKERLTAYLAGQLDRIEELEEVRLRLDGKTKEEATLQFHDRFLWMGYQTYSTANKL